MEDISARLKSLNNALNTLTISCGEEFGKLFIVGSPRSGTSFLRKIFLEHDNTVGITAESHIYPIIGKFLDNSENDSDDYCWKEILKKYDYFEFRKGINKLVTRKELCGFIKEVKSKNLSRGGKMQLLIDKIFRNFFIKNKGDKGKLFIEKTPFHIYYADKILDIYKKAKIVEIVRDGRDVCVSLENLNKRGITWASKERIDQIELWKDRIQRGAKLHLREEYRDRIMQVKYEDLLVNKEYEIKHLFDFAGLEYTPEIIKSIAKLTDRLFDRGINQNSGNWKKSFTLKDIDLFKKIANKELIDLGYCW